jgi:ZIP family zinc transporter/zinc and cadmium transporter
LNTALLYALAAAGANLLGGLIITAPSNTGRATQRLMIAFGAGFMIATALVGMIPHAVEAGPNAAFAVLVGYLLVHLTQHVLTPHFHFGEETHQHAMVDRWVGTAALLGLLLHTFFDGVAIASGFAVGEWLGLLVFLAILIHKMPEGVTVASIMLASGNSRRRAIVAVLLLGLSTILGVLLTSQVKLLSTTGLALSAGVTLYVGASNLVPEVQKKPSRGSALAVFLGAGLFYATYLVLRRYVHP